MKPCSTWPGSTKTTAVAPVRPATISGLLLWLDEQATAGEDAQAEPGVNAIRLLTHHAAKGLEWPVVILTDLDKTIRNQLWGISTISTDTVDAVNPLKNRFIRFWPWPFGKQESGIAVADAIHASPIAHAFKEAAQAEARRLLYVSMTRPREMLILARKQKAKEEPWLDTLGADWLSQVDVTAKTLMLPSKMEIPAKIWELPSPEPQEPLQAKTSPVHWFAQLPEQERLPLYCNPSSAAESAPTIKEQVVIGQRISVTPGADWSILGTALHACLAASFTDPIKPITEEDVARLLDNFQMRKHLDPAAVLGQIRAFQDWINARWPGCKPLAEVPVKTRLLNGQILNGRMDLLLDTPEGFILIDHKSSPLGSDKWEKLGQEYGGQLAAYGKTVEMTHGQQELGFWLFFPVAGGCVQLEQ